ncbi:polysaccharide deacetylase family protein [Candidatus Thioglobus sp.]|nr:polysaccharide deacetylase family protein [Candidatus Thioglobus sp.]
MPPFSLMLHHFYDHKNHPKGQGAISGDDFECLLDYMTNNYSLLNAKDWMNLALDGSLDKDDVCLSFDDGLRCQYDIALPILNKRGLTAFWFIYSSVFEGSIGKIELYRYYRTVKFKDIFEFYEAFEVRLKKFNFYKEVEIKLQKFNASEYLIEHSIYTDQDRRFRFIRDIALGSQRYEQVMDSMISDSDINADLLFKHLWMDNDCIRDLHTIEHIIGLHSYSHPTRLSDLSINEQYEEYSQNYTHISRLLGVNPTSVSHPCNSYNKDTLEVLNNLGVNLGFRSNMSQPKPLSLLEFPREDHSIIMKKAGLRS